MRPGRLSLPAVAFAAYVASTLLMVPRGSLLPAVLAGKGQPADLVFLAGLAVWLLAGAPGLARIAAPAGRPAAVWVGANVLVASVAPWPGPAWRETAAFVYLALVLIWGAAVLGDPGRLARFLRWWVVLVAAVVGLGLAGWVFAAHAGAANYLVEFREGLPVLGDRLRVRATLQPTSRLLATLLIVALPAVVSLARRGGPWTRRGCLALLAAMTVCEVLTWARPLLEYLAVLGVLGVLEVGRRRRPLLAGVAVLYVVGLLLTIAVSTWQVTAYDVTWGADRSRTVRHPFYASMPDTGVESLVLRVEWVHNLYFVLKRIAVHAFLARPLAGWGQDAWPHIQAWAGEMGYAPRAERWESAHGEPFTVAAEMGVIGLVAFGAFWALTLRAMWPGARPGFAAGLARGQTVASAGVLLASLHLDLMRFRFLWIALALGVAAARCAKEEPA
ncbi:MAG TPA: hypothetical protein VFC42_09090 [Methylomirabilota bacterium]|nr:hypothetical protein [Methylomirabilota bacterium]